MWPSSAKILASDSHVSYGLVHEFGLALTGESGLSKGNFNGRYISHRYATEG